MSARGLLGSVNARLVSVIGVSALLVGLLALAPVAGARTTANLSLNVNFTATGAISVTLPDGTPVGAPSGTPTVIPAGFYTLNMTGPGGCTSLPYFHLKGPGNNILENMDEGEVNQAISNANFLPSSTYVWTNDESPGVVYTFVTSANIVGTAPATAQSSTTGISSGTHSTASSQDLVGSGLVPFRGKLTGAVSAGGQLTLAFKGKAVTRLAAGKYTIAAIDKSKQGGVVLEKANHQALNVTGSAFVGKHSASVVLTAGRWFFAPGLSGKKTYFSVVK